MTRAGTLARLLAAGCLACVIGSWPVPASAQDAPGRSAAPEAADPDPGDTPQPGATVRDPDFGVSSRHYGLARDVEMYQWRTRADGGYERAWSAIPIDSGTFAPGHANPPFPLQSRRWPAAEVRVDGLPLDQSVLQAFGQWVPFRPSFSALPGNLAATFQPQGDGLGTAENPMAPEAGDLRIHWRDFVLPPLADRIVLEGGRWRIAPGTAAATDIAGGAPAAATNPAGARSRTGWVRIALWLGAFLAVFAAGFVLARKRRR